MDPTSAEESVVIGRILGPWGVKGWLQIYSYTDPREGIFVYAPWQVEGSDEPIRPLEHKHSGKRLVVRLPGIETPEQALIWAGKHISVDRQQLSPLPAGEYYWHDLVGLTVVNREGHTLGQVRQMLATGANDVMEVQSKETASNILIPFVLGVYVDEVLLSEGQVRVDWPIEWLADEAQR